MAALGTGCVPAAPQTRIDLRVLVLNDAPPGLGASAVEAVREELKREGVPYQEVNISDPARPVINAAFLSSTTGTNPVVERAKFQAVVSANQAVTCTQPNCTGALSATELADLRAFEAKFGVRHVIAQTWAHREVGLNDFTATPGYVGWLDDMTASVTPAGQSGPFNYLAGPVRFDPVLNGTNLSWGTLAPPRTDLPAGETFTSYVTMPIPGTSSTGTVVGAYAHEGREELIVTAGLGSHLSQFQALARGFVTWMTKGIHLGFNRSYLTVHVDDLFAADSRWNPTLNCTPGEDCPAGTPAGSDIRMTAADISATVAWQQANNFRFDWAYNGFGSDSWVEDNGSDPLLTAAKANVGQFGWINHTYTHEFLGCQQDFTVIPWRCKTDAAGQTLYVSQATIVDEINRNKTFATTHGLPINAAELVTGEHSGTFILPQQPNDNPNLAPALTATGITSLAADNSRQPNTRVIGTARTVPRHPLTNYFNVGTKAEMADEWNWLQTSAADGGSGICTANGFQCQKPIDTATGYDTEIIPFETRETLRRMLGNDPRPHYVHQSNLAEERILLPMMGAILGRYRSTFNATVPPVRVTQTQAALLLLNQSQWAAGANQVEAYTQNGTLHINKGTYTGAVPVTVPDGARVGFAQGPLFGEPYAGERSAWVVGPGPHQIVLAPSPAPAP